METDQSDRIGNINATPDGTYIPPEKAKRLETVKVVRDAAGAVVGLADPSGNADPIRLALAEELAAMGFEFIDIPGETTAAYVEV